MKNWFRTSHVVVFMVLAFIGISAAQGSADWSNPIVPQRADPHVLLHFDGYYYMTATVPEYDRIELRRAKTLGGLSTAEPKVIWRKHKKGPMGAHIWAPEIHFIDGKWYIYFTAAPAEQIWEIRPQVLECADKNPLTGKWVEKGEIKLNWESFSLDATTFAHNGKRYLVWTQRGDKPYDGTNIYIAEMDTPTSIAGKAVMLTYPEYEWETRKYRVNEAPAVLIKNGKVFMTYSASATDANYCLGMLVADKEANLLDAKSWKKSTEPVFKSSAENSQFGPGHNCFTTTPDGKTDVLVYHARSYEKIKGDPLHNPDRATRAQVLEWDRKGFPIFGTPLPDSPPVLTIDAGKAKAKVSPIHYGLMTEEINYCYDGGLYAELVRNRVFKDDPDRPVNWSVEGEGSMITLDKSLPLNDELGISLRWDIGTKPSRLANTGYWGIPVLPNTKYKASFYARAAANFKGPVGVAIVSLDGKTVYAQGEVPSIGKEWSRYELTLETGAVEATDQARLVLATQDAGRVWLNLVSLFPPTWNDRPNGLRKDLMQMLVDLQPKFLRFPGGNYLEGNTVEERFKWWETLGDLTERPGHPCPWGYRSSDGMGLHEFLLWTEDMGAEPVVGLYAGYNLDKSYIEAGPLLEPYVQEALDEIEYIIGPVDSKWGAKRAAAGHPEPFPLRYVEIGNEDWFDVSGSYEGRYAQFHDAIKAKYPELKCISSVGYEQSKWLVKSRQPDVLDEHYYRSTDEFIKMVDGYYEKYDRNGPEIFVGEWAAHEDGRIRPWDKGAKEQPPTPNMTSAVGDAVFMAAMERNSDIVTMQAYAPLFVNVNEYQWRPDLIGYNAYEAFGSPSYYALRMFSTNVGDEILKATFSGKSEFHGTVTRDRSAGIIYIKLVNPKTKPEVLTITLEGAKPVAPRAVAEVMSAKPDATNSIDDPVYVVPETIMVDGIQETFSYELPAYSVVVLKIQEK